MSQANRERVARIRARLERHHAKGCASRAIAGADCDCTTAVLFADELALLAELDRVRGTLEAFVRMLEEPDWPTGGATPGGPVGPGEWSSLMGGT